MMTLLIIPLLLATIHLLLLLVLIVAIRIAQTFLHFKHAALYVVWLSWSWLQLHVITRHISAICQQGTARTSRMCFCKLLQDTANTASWIAENSVNTSYIIPVQDENPINVVGGKQEETCCNSKTCTRPEDTAQKIRTNSNGKHNSSSFLKDSKLKTGPQCQPSTEEISKDCNASTDDKEDACNSTSSQGSMPKKKAEFQPEKLNEKKKFQCNHCTSSFTTNFSFRRHMQSQTSNSYR